MFLKRLALGGRRFAVRVAVAMLGEVFVKMHAGNVQAAVLDNVPETL